MTKKQMLEVKRPKSWLKSVSAFANGEGGMLIFGISDDNQVVGLADAEGDAERISEEVKSKLDPVPAINLEYKEIDGKSWCKYKCIRDRKLRIITLEISNALHLSVLAMNRLLLTACN
ncbi:AlbA family DNA-binding domain-containing protein [Bacteroides acidifaciens]|uniref:AlbA family DNA-binding domain-containing protein n=1 Tax=Bacteroides acidifaciens TaxID=85831 RepID=UPI0025B77754|nr:ATP-binding protein [Bacteroides acidifaciens]